MITSLSETRAGDTVIVRSHGEPEEFFKEAKERGLTLVDTTCVFVKKIHEIVSNAHKDGRPIVLIGDGEHPEVIATNGWCNYEAIVIGSVEEAREKLTCLTSRDSRYVVAEQGGGECSAATGTLAGESHGKSKPVIVCQTTIKEELLRGVLEAFDEAGLDYEIHNTICNATRDRQDSCKELAASVDMMVVVGDTHSSNSKKLYEIAKKTCKNSIFVENKHNFQLLEARKYNKIGVVAGASTPEWIIKEVISSMSENVTKDMELNPMMEFMDDIEKSLRLPKPGDIIEGKVDQVMDSQVIVNMGCKKDGILRIDEVVLEEGQKLSDIFKEGDDIQAKVIKSDDGEGGILLSKKRLVAVENYTELEAAMENKEVINVKVLRAVNGGVIAAYKEITGFIPMSHISDRFVESADEFLGQSMDVQVIKVDAKKGRAVFSRKFVLINEKDKAKAEVWDNLHVGDVVEGKVMRFTDYGAFVDIGGVDGLLHISEISWGKIKHPQEALKIGEIIQVKVLSLNEEKGKISLGLKQLQPEPWSLVGDKYNVGDVLEGKVVSTQDYGAFVEIEAGLDGLVHISEIADKRVEKVNEELKVGETVQVKIMEINSSKRRISLSIKAANPAAEAEEVEEAAPEAAEAPEVVEEVEAPAAPVAEEAEAEEAKDEE